MKTLIDRIQSTIRPTFELIANCLYLAKKVFLIA